MNNGIIWVDMHIRDERVLEWLKDISKGSYCRVTHEQIAQKFGCHRNTAIAIVKRLKGANLIISEGAKKGGMYDKVNQYVSK